MKEINLGSVIHKKRKEKAITQEELAAYLGVSKPAVSKWESGQSYPDITLLPAIAAYFSISLDELMGYDPQLSSQAIRKLYLELADSFSKEPFDAVLERCQELCRKYYACWEFLYQMGMLLLNHSNLAPNPAAMNDTITEALRLFQRVRRECGSLTLARQALYMEASCCIALRDPVQAIDLLDDVQKPEFSPLSLLALAYQMKGDTGKAEAIFQRTVYQSVMSMLGDFSCLISLYADRPEKAEECLHRALKVGEIFHMDKLFPSSYLSLYLSAAAVLIAAGEKEKSLDLLERYASLAASSAIYPLEIKGDAFFDKLDDYIASLDLEGNAPRNQEVIRRSLLDGVQQNPAFSPLEGEARFSRILNKLRQEV